MWVWGILSFLGVVTVGSRAAPLAAGDGLDLLVFHTNDMHARFEQTNRFSGTCSERDERNDACYGGYARISTLVKKARQEAADNSGPPVLLLNAGDNYQGTVYYTFFKHNITSVFTNLLNFDALSLGNHEFDDDISGLAPFLDEVKSPIVTANIDVSEVPALQNTNLKPSVVVDVNGTKVGIIGYLTPNTKYLSKVGNVKFLDEVEVLSKEAQRFKEEGVNIIICVGHSGYQKDQEIAAEVPDVDIVIGGHSHSFLYTGPQPDVDVPEGLYPTFVTQASGRKVPVVQAYAFTKYMGKLRLSFDATGELTTIKGEPILLNNKVEQDPEVLEILSKWKANLDKDINKSIGKTFVMLNGDSCRKEECNLGNLVADAFVFYRAEKFARDGAGGNGWTDAPIALENSGAIRRSIDASTNDGEITVKDVAEVMPFDNINVKLKLKGSIILEALEFGVQNMSQSTWGSPAFLQVSGLRVEYDLGRPTGKRVVSVHARCGNCTVPEYSDLKPDQVYGVVMSSFIANGGDGFTMFANHEEAVVLDDTDTQILQDYIRSRAPIYPGVEGRLVFHNSASAPSSAANLPQLPLTTILIIAFALLRIWI